MNKKFLSAILFGALMVSSTGTFVSCKDYDDDIDRIDKELSEVEENHCDSEIFFLFFCIFPSSLCFIWFFLCSA